MNIYIYILFTRLEVHKGKKLCLRSSVRPRSEGQLLNLLLIELRVFNFCQGYHNSMSRLLSSCVKSLPPLEMKGSHKTGNSMPYSFEQCVGSFVSRRVVNTEELWHRTYGLLSSSEKTRVQPFADIIITKAALSTLPHLTSCTVVLYLTN